MAAQRRRPAGGPVQEIALSTTHRSASPDTRRSHALIIGPGWPMTRRDATKSLTKKAYGIACGNCSHLDCCAGPTMGRQNFVATARSHVSVASLA
jgi:hypothetical protein